MHFKRLEIQGFKTFAGRTVLEFRPGVTAIVGPNGSGKSNIADAVRWVLGEQSYTALRCKRTEELLFSGGGRRPPAGLAEVSLTVDNSDRLLPLAFDEVTITRRATRAGDNEYLINRARVRLRDVQEATEPLGGSYTIINQGLVDAALTLRPDERRRLFEDAAEIGGFEVRKAEAGRRLRETHANVQRVADLLGDLEPRLRSLKRQATQARMQRELSDELHGVLRRHYAAQWRAVHLALRAADRQVAALSAELEQARAAQATVSSRLRALRETLRARREQLGDLHQQSRGLHGRAETAQRDLAVAAERLAALSRRVEELERSQHELEARASEVQSEHSAALAALAGAETALAERQAQLASAEAEVAGAASARQSLARELAAAEETTLQAAAALAGLRSRGEQLADQRARLDQEQSGLEAAQQQAGEQLETARREVETLRAALEAAEQQQADAAQAETDARAGLQALREQQAAGAEALAAARRTLADHEARLESLNRLARSYTGTFAGVRAAMQWAERSERAGFALVATIIHTPAELETAIEVALGSRLQNIVVERWQDAEEAIDELKRSGAGRATFMPLDTLRPPPTDRPPAVVDRAAPDAAVLGVAATLVQYEERYHPVAQQLLGRVLVVRDLPTARQEVRRLPGGWMLVTLSGEQVQSGGAVTGGARTKETGTLRRERELRELPRQVQAARASVDGVEQQQRAREEQVAHTGRAVREAEQRRQEAGRRLAAQRTALDAAGRRLEQATRELEWQRDRYAAMARDREGLAVQEQELRDQQAQADARAAAAQAQLEQLRARQAQEAHTDRAIQAHLSELRAAVAHAEGQVRTERALAAAHAQTLERVGRQRADATRRLHELAADHARVAEARAQVEQAHRALLAEIDTLRAQIGPLEAEVQAQESEQAGLEQQETRATATLLELEAAHNRAGLEAQRARDRREHLAERAAADGIALDEPADDLPAAAADADPELPARIQGLRERLARLGTVNPLALEEYEQTAERSDFLRTQLDDLHQAEATLRELIRELDTSMHSQFVQTFSAIASEFERSFTRLFGGGTARLRLVGNGSGTPDANGADGEAEAPAALGVEITARPPGKRPQNLSLLSGGERALTAAALLFAILTVNPSPFCILDEVDAALDESNVGRFRDVLTDLTRQTQCILITHNRGTIEAADTLYGITMGDDGVSRVLSLRVEELAAQPET